MIKDLHKEKGWGASLFEAAEAEVKKLADDEVLRDLDSAIKKEQA